MKLTRRQFVDALEHGRAAAAPRMGADGAGTRWRRWTR